MVTHTSLRWLNNNGSLHYDHDRDGTYGGSTAVRLSSARLSTVDFLSPSDMNATNLTVCTSKVALLKTYYLDCLFLFLANGLHVFGSLNWLVWVAWYCWFRLLRRP